MSLAGPTRELNDPPSKRTRCGSDAELNGRIGYKQVFTPGALLHDRQMIFEHFALNVPDVRAMSRWYVEHLGFTITRQRADAPYTHFLSDDARRVVVELYSNPTAAVLDFATLAPLSFHFAVVALDAVIERRRLESAGASFVVEDRLADGSVLIMMRDPWGVPVQLCQRTSPFPGYEKSS